jgi:general secretion pathway protein N
VTLRPAALFAIGAVAYVAFLGATIPARWIEARLDASAPRAYEMNAMTGTLWHGEGQAVLQAPGGTLVVDHVGWRFLPSRLLQGRIAFALDVRGAGVEASGEAARTLSGWAVRDLNAQADAALAVAAFPLAGRWRPEGRVSLAAPAIDARGDDIRGEATIEWKSAATTLSQVRPLGSYRAVFAADGPGANVTVSTLEGALSLRGNGRLDWPLRVNFMGEARAEPTRAAQLAPLLDLIGPPKPDGSRTLDLRTR